MTEREKLYTAKLYMEKLANGINPLDGSDVPEDSVLNQVALCRSFIYISDILGQVIANHGVVSWRPNSKKDPFCITEEQRSNIWISETPIGVSAIASHINAQLDPHVKSIAGTHIASWLEGEGLLKTVLEGTQKVKLPTSEGEALGILCETRISRDNIPYKKNLYSAGAQAFVIAHLEAIAEFAHK